MQTRAAAVATYIRAKDGNRPHLVEDAFAAEAVLEMTVDTASIAFPPRTIGRHGISDVLVRRFGQTYENVYTFCLASPPPDTGSGFACDWLVGMSEKATGAVRVGCGRYDWRFRDRAPFLVERLAIRIHRMEILPAEQLAPVVHWLAALPYPWCPPEVARTSIPALPGLSAIAAFLGASRLSGP